MARHADDGGRGLPCIWVIGEAAPAADLITQLIFKALERNLAGSPDLGVLHLNHYILQSWQRYADVKLKRSDPEELPQWRDNLQSERARRPFFV